MRAACAASNLPPEGKVGQIWVLICGYLPLFGASAAEHATTCHWRARRERC